MDNKGFLLRWQYHLYNLDTNEAYIETKEAYFNKFEDLLKFYRNNKNNCLLGYISYNTNFEVFTVKIEKQNIDLDILA